MNSTSSLSSISSSNKRKASTIHSPTIPSSSKHHHHQLEDQENRPPNIQKTNRIPLKKNTIGINSSKSIYPLHELRQRPEASSCKINLRISTRKILQSKSENLNPTKETAASEREIFNSKHEHSYELEAYESMRKAQSKFQPNPSYFSCIQKGKLNESMRVIVIDWMAEVVHEYAKGLATLFLAVNYLDRFLSERALCKERFQLLAVTCLLIAGKVEEVKPFGLRDLALATDHSCSEEEILKMEILVLQTLDFRLAAPTAYEFVSYFSQLNAEEAHFSQLNAQEAHFSQLNAGEAHFSQLSAQDTHSSTCKSIKLSVASKKRKEANFIAHSLLYSHEWAIGRSAHDLALLIRDDFESAKALSHSILQRWQCIGLRRFHGDFVIGGGERGKEDENAI